MAWTNPVGLKHACMQHIYLTKTVTAISRFTARGLDKKTWISIDTPHGQYGAYLKYICKSLASTLQFRQKIK